MGDVVTGEVGAFLLIMYLLPGFLGLVVYDFIAESEKRDNFGRFIGALSLTLVSGIVVGLISHKAILPPEFASDAKLRDVIAAFLNIQVVWLTLASCILAVGIAFGNNKGYLYRAARCVGITYRTGRIDVWQEVFHGNRGKWVRIQFSDGRTLIGWPQYYSEFGKERELFLAKALWRIPQSPAGPDQQPVYREREVTGAGTYIGNFDLVTAIDILD